MYAYLLLLGENPAILNASAHKILTKYRTFHFSMHIHSVKSIFLIYKKKQILENMFCIFKMFVKTYFRITVCCEFRGTEISFAYFLLWLVPFSLQKPVHAYEFN